MLSGAHMPNRAITPADLDRFSAGKFAAAKLMHYHTPDDVIALKQRGASMFLCRLPNSQNWDGSYPNADDYVQFCLSTIRQLYPQGVRVFQLDNEPNWQWTKQGYGPWEYQYWMRLVVHALRPQIPNTIRLVSPPLSFAPALWRVGPQNPSPFTLDDWLNAFRWDNHGIGAPLWSLFDCVGANIYWQSERQLYDPSFGLAYEQLHARAGGRSVVVCEYGNSLGDRQQPPPLPGEIESQMLLDYPEWLMLCKDADFVDATYMFILGSNGDWTRFEPTDAVLQAVGKWTTRKQRPTVIDETRPVTQPTTIPSNN